VSKEYPPFTGDNPRCVKCGNEGAYTEWKPAEKLGSTVLSEERLRRRCSRCDYEWDEATIAPKTGEPGE
jgi:ribosomal protein S27AE